MDFSMFHHNENEKIRGIVNSSFLSILEFYISGGRREDRFERESTQRFNRDGSRANLVHNIRDELYNFETTIIEGPLPYGKIRRPVSFPIVKFNQGLGVSSYPLNQELRKRIFKEEVDPDLFDKMWANNYLATIQFFEQVYIEDFGSKNLDPSWGLDNAYNSK